MSDAWDYIINNNGIDNETAYQYNSGYSGYVMEKKIQIYYLNKKIIFLFFKWNGQCRYNQGGKFNVFVDSYVDVPADELSLQTALATKGPISVGFYVTNNFKYYSSGVFYDTTCPIGEANHAVTLVGYDTDSSGRQYYILRNQWGTDWGK